jgi:hypothetical protein
VNEIDETLSLCFDETQKLIGRVQEVFENHLSATEVLVQDPLGLLKAKYTTHMHRLFVMEELWQGFFMVRCVCMQLLSVCCACVYVYCICLLSRDGDDLSPAFVFRYLSYVKRACLRVCARTVTCVGVRLKS